MSRLGLSTETLKEIFVFARGKFPYDPDVWGDTLEEAVQRTRDGYYVPYPQVCKLVEHMTEMRQAVFQMEAALEAKAEYLRDWEAKLAKGSAKPLVPRKKDAA